MEYRKEINMKKYTKTLIKISFILYLLLLSWIIVLKFRLNLNDLKYIRSINLIPFKANTIKETLVNLITFIPLGMYLQYLFKDKKTLNILIIILTSLFYEILQYTFHIGVSDITDIIMNTTGGIIGVLLIKENNQLKKILEITLIMLPFIILLILFLI